MVVHHLWLDMLEELKSWTTVPCGSVFLARLCGRLWWLDARRLDDVDWANVSLWLLIFQLRLVSGSDLMKWYKPYICPIRCFCILYVLIPQMVCIFNTPLNICLIIAQSSHFAPCMKCPDVPGAGAWNCLRLGLMIISRTPGSFAQLWGGVLFDLIQT